MILTKNVTCVNYKKTEQARSVIFSMNTYPIHVIIYAQNQSPSFIHFFWPNGQIYMFQTKTVIYVYYRKMEQARSVIFSMNTYPIHVIICAQNQSPSLIHFFWPNGQIYMFQTKNLIYVYYRKTRKVRAIIFDIGTFYIHMSTHTKN